MDSHILVPKEVFKEFLDGRTSYFKYDVKKGSISIGFPKKTFTEEDYYSATMEKKLNVNIETPLKELLFFCRGIVGSDTIIITEHLIEIAQIYFKSLIARNPKMCDSVSKNSVFFQFYSTQDQHDITVDLTMANLSENEFIKKLDLSFLINKTEIPFVLPTRGFYEHVINGVSCYAVPVNPCVCLHFKEKGKEIHKGEACNTYLLIPNDMDDFVYELNKFAFIKQKNDGLGYVVSSERDMLDSLMETTKE